MESTQLNQSRCFVKWFGKTGLVGQRKIPVGKVYKSVFLFFFLLQTSMRTDNVLLVVTMTEF